MGSAWCSHLGGTATVLPGSCNGWTQEQTQEFSEMMQDRDARMKGVHTLWIMALIVRTLTITVQDIKMKAWKVACISLPLRIRSSNMASVNPDLRRTVWGRYQSISASKDM